MKIKATIERIPGGMMLVPLVLGAILNTLAPNTGAYFGGFTKGMITGTVPILAVWFIASAHLLTCVQQVRYYVNQGRWSLLKLRSPGLLP